MEEEKKWLIKGKRDLEASEINLNEGFYEIASFLAHQAVEKSLKALYIKKFKRLWKIHDLVELGRKVGLPKKLLKLCDELNPHYIQTRYPVDVIYTKEMAEDAIKNAEKVVEWVESQLKK